MGKVMVEEKSLQDIADAIRNKTGDTQATYLPSDMGLAVENIPSGGIEIIQGTFTLAQDGGVGAYEVQGDFSNVIAIIVTAEKTDVQLATKTKNSIHIQVVSMFPDCILDKVQISSANYTGYAGYWYGYNTNNAERNGICLASRSIGINDNKTSILFSPGGATEPVYVANVTYTYKIYKVSI